MIWEEKISKKVSKHSFKLLFETLTRGEKNSWSQEIWYSKHCVNIRPATLHKRIIIIINHTTYVALSYLLSLACQKKSRKVADVVEIKTMPLFSNNSPLALLINYSI